MLLKKGLTDPAQTLVKMLKQMLKDYVTEAEIDAQLVKPYRRRE